MQNGSSLQQAMEAALDTLDGFYTFVIGTEDGFGVLRDPIACKPAVMAETRSAVSPSAPNIARWSICPGIKTREFGSRSRPSRICGNGIDAHCRSWRTRRCATLNAALHTPDARPPTRRIGASLNPRGQHAIAAGIDAPVLVEIDGHVGYYCAGMNQARDGHRSWQCRGRRRRKHDVRPGPREGDAAKRPARPVVAACW